VVDDPVTQAVHRHFDKVLEACGLQPNPYCFPIHEFGDVTFLYEGDRTSMPASATRWLDFTDPDEGAELWIRIRPRKRSVSVEMEYLELEHELTEKGVSGLGICTEALDEAFASLSSTLNSRLMGGDPE
jgi:hypothetical protein